jgi:hypothetical protein
MTMKKFSMLGNVALVGLVGMFGGCVANGADDPSSQDEASSKGESPQDKGNVTCATGSTVNSSTTIDGGGGERYARTATEIDTTCGCAQWQKNENGSGEAGSATDCRPWTWVDATIEQPGNAGVQLGGDVQNWGTTSKTECDNSELDIAIEEEVAGTWYPVWPTTAGHYYLWHPTFNPSTGSCEELEHTYDPSDIGVYRVKTRAIRGLDADNHGYAGLYTIAQPVNID